MNSTITRKYNKILLLNLLNWKEMKLICKKYIQFFQFYKLENGHPKFFVRGIFQFLRNKNFDNKKLIWNKKERREEKGKKIYIVEGYFCLSKG